ncbi:tRNA threonylcarbamoyladenosine biosynthesis protein TsaE [Variovorax sp. GrIS 2.14]
MKAVVKPVPESGLGIGEVDARNTDLGESQLTRPLLYARHDIQRHQITSHELSTDHTPIVETPLQAAPLPSLATELPAVLQWHTEADTDAFARCMATAPMLRDAFIALHGELGAGKTTFVRHLLRALGIEGRIKSPTYAVVEPHEAPDGLSIYHFDFYRFNDPREWDDAGFRDIFAGPGLKLAEWPDNAAGRIPVADLALKMEAMTDDSRTVTLLAGTARGFALLAHLDSARPNSGPIAA